MEFVDKENLPKFLGGSCDCGGGDDGCLRKNVGPWNPEGLEIYPSKKKNLNLVEEEFEDIDE